MKKFFSALCFLFLLSACDDGDIEIASFDFSASTVKVCQAGIPGNFYLYVIKDKRALILKIPESNFNNQLLPPIKLLTIDAINQATYREYAGTVSDDNICGFPTNVSLGLQKEWNGVGGTIQIETSVAKVENAADGSSRYPTYNHRISLINPSFNNGAGGEQKMDLIEFGTYSKINENNLNDFTPITLKKCATSTYFYKSSGRQSLELSVDSSIFSTTILDVVKTRVINGSTNKFLFKVFNANVSDPFFCAATVPATPTIAETWTARNGSATTGIIEVITTSVPGTNPQQYLHRITLKNLIVENNGLFFNFDVAYNLGFFEQ